MMVDDALVFAVNLANQAGKLLRTYYNPAGIHASAKADHTVVTEADLASDRMITAAIHAHYPQDEVVSEESSHRVQHEQAVTWIVDPLDGTTNFSLGLSIWGVLIARVSAGLVDFGVMYFPMIDELYTAKRGGGAFMNNIPIKVRAPDPSQPMSFFACCSRTFRNYNVSIPYKPRILGSCAYSFCMVGRGSALLGFDATSKIWDLAAAWVLVEEAGGRMAAFEGPSPFPLSNQINYATTSFPTLASASSELEDMGRQKIQRKAKLAVDDQKTE